MILYKNTNKNLQNLINNRFVYQFEAAAEAAQEALNEKGMKEANKLAEKKQDWDFRMDVKPEAKKRIERNPWTDKDQKNYGQLLAKMTDDQQTEHYNKVNKRAEKFLGSEKIKEGQVEEADYAVKTTEQLAKEDATAAKKQLAKVTREILEEKPEVVSEEFSARKKEQALKLVAGHNGEKLAKLFGGSPKKLVGSMSKAGLIKMIEGKGFTNDQARQIESVIYNATRSPFILNGKKVTQMAYYKDREAREKQAGEVAKIDLGGESDKEADKKAADSLF